MYIKLLKKDNFLIPPKRSHLTDAGADVVSTIKATIKPHEVLPIPLGYGVEIPNGYVGYLLPRSGHAKQSLSVLTPPIDSGYTGELILLLANLSNTPKTIEVGQRVGQLVIMPIVIADFIDTDYDERGDRGFNSTGSF